MPTTNVAIVRYLVAIFTFITFVQYSEFFRWKVTILRTEDLVFD